LRCRLALDPLANLRFSGAILQFELHAVDEYSSASGWSSASGRSSIIAHVAIEASQGMGAPSGKPGESRPYPPAPWELFGHGQIHLLALQPGQLERIPDGFSPVLWRGRALLLAGFIDYRAGSVLRYHELYVAALGRLAGSRSLRATVTHMWVDSEASRRGGRELWGYPKEIARFALAINPGGSAFAADGSGEIASARLRTALVLPARISLHTGTVQPLNGALRRAPYRLSGRPALGRGSFVVNPEGPLGFLAQARHLLACGMRDFHVSFG
jgi:hypothetical protein